MSKPKAKDEAAPAEPKKRSKLKLVVLAIVPLILAGGGYVGYTQFFAGGHAAAGEHAADGGHGTTDAVVVSAVPSEIAAETSFTHSFAISVLMRTRCGALGSEALTAASEKEAQADGQLVNLSWMAAARRAGGFSRDDCGYIVSEIDSANEKAAGLMGGGKDAKKPAH